MPQTAPGWILYIAILLSAYATAGTATTLILSAFGRGERDWWNIPAAFAFGALLMIATTLFIWVEPKPI